MTNQAPAPSPFTGLRTAVESTMTLDPAELSDGELAATILGFRRELDRLDSVFADLVLAGHRRGVGREDGYESTPSWLRARAGLKTGEVHAAVAAGELGEVLQIVGARADEPTRRRWPGCEIPPGWCETHHVKHWQHGGETSYANGVLLCSRHHHFLHAHPTWQVVWDQTTFRVFRPDGTEVCPTLDLEPPDPDVGIAGIAGP